MESWKKVWREGIVPQLSAEELKALREALVNDDGRLLQGATTQPPPLHCVQDWPAEAACLLGLCGVVRHGGFGHAKVEEVEGEFSQLCFNAGQLLGEPAACRWFLNWYDDTPRDEMRRELLAEVEYALCGKTDEFPVPELPELPDLTPAGLPF